MNKERALVLLDVILDDFLETHQDTADVDPTNKEIMEAYNFIVAELTSN